jgi:hypothetical protein
MKYSIYLNESRDSFFGFDPDNAELRFANSVDLEGVVHENLENIFDQLNIGGDLIPHSDLSRRYREDGNRSLSKGDVISVSSYDSGPRFYAVAGSGYREIDSNAFVAAQRRYNVSLLEALAGGPR